MANLSEMIHGRKPDFAPLKILDPIELLRQLLQGEITDWPQIQELGNLFQTDVFDKLSQAGLDLKSLIGLGGEDAQATLEAAKPLIKGIIPDDVAQQVMRSSAFQSLGAGSLGGPMGSALAARNLGLSSLDLMRQGADLATSGGNAAQRWAQIAMGTMLPQQSQLYTPDWFANFRQQQEVARTANKQLKYNLEAAPDPQWADRAKMLASLLGSFAGPGGSAMGQYASGSYGQNFGGASGGTTGSMMASGSPGAPSTNPGFFANFQSGYGGQPTQGVGGFLGSIWPGHQTTQYMGGMPSDVSNPGYTPTTTTGGTGDPRVVDLFNQSGYYG